MGYTVDMNTAQVLGRVEIADLLQVDTRTPHAWYGRKLMPAPDHQNVNGSPAWNRDTIISWAARTGRLPDVLESEAALLGVPVQKGQRGGKRAKREHGLT